MITCLQESMLCPALSRVAPRSCAGRAGERGGNPTISAVWIQGVVESVISALPLTPMSRSPTAIPARERVAALRARREAAGMARVWADLPGELVAQLDRAKQEKGVQSRAPIIEEALRFYFDKQQGA